MYDIYIDGSGGWWHRRSVPLPRIVNKNNQLQILMFCQSLFFDRAEGQVWTAATHSQTLSKTYQKSFSFLYVLVAFAVHASLVEENMRLISN